MANVQSKIIQSKKCYWCGENNALGVSQYCSKRCEDNFTAFEKCKNRAAVIISDSRAHKPWRTTAGAAGYDIASVKRYEIEPQKSVKVDSGIRIVLPKRCCALIVGRSSYFLKDVLFFNGLIDSDYQNTVRVLVHNIGSQTVVINEGDRIAQLVIFTHYQKELLSITDIPYWKKSLEHIGFGSTGT
jgi:dUTP pyrophosphatase